VGNIGNILRLSIPAGKPEAREDGMRGIMILCGSIAFAAIVSVVFLMQQI
jgi:hypothetical protein